MNRGRFCEIVLFEFLLSTLQSNRNILSPEQVFIPAVSILKIANVHVGTRKPILSLATGFYSRQMYFHSRCVYMKISNIHVGTIHRNVRISN